jgi:formylglycine-generating enzyme
MTPTVACPQCGEFQRVDADQLGTPTRCPVCGQTLAAQIAHGQSSASTLGQEAASQVNTSESTMLAMPLLGLEGYAGTSGTPSLPAKIGSYLVRQRLGGGIMGEVFRAFDPDLNRDVAIRTLRPEHARDPQRKQIFLREARAAAKLHHLNVVAVHQICTEGEDPYLVMEFVEGKSLGKLCSPEQPMPWRTATRALQDGASGLSVAHGIRLIHGELQPTNLIRSRSGVTKVLGFGLARAAATIARLTGQERSTLADFSAPEVRLGQDPDPLSDLYSLICTYYYLLTGHPPFPSAAGSATDDPHRIQPLPDPRRAVQDMPESVCRILLRGSQQDPRDRYQTAAELLADLEAVLALPDRAPEVGAGQPALASPADQDDALQGRKIKAGSAVHQRRRKLGLRRFSLTTRTRVVLGGPVVALLLLGALFTINHQREAGPARLPNAAIRVAEKAEATAAASVTAASAPSSTATDATAGKESFVPVPPLVVPFDGPPAKRHQEAWATFLGIPVEAPNSLGMTMVLIPPGEFVMGAVGPDSPSSQARQQHAIRISQPFLMSKHEVTVGQFRTFATAQSYQSEVMRNGIGTMAFDASSARWPRGPQYHWQHLGFAQTDDHPVAGVSWNDADAFCQWLQEKEGRSYRLPTDAEWEYACRAGTIAVPQVSDSELARSGNFADASLKRAFPAQKAALDADDGYPQSAPVGSFPPNPFGLCDMLGNVAERCVDTYVPGSDPSRPADGRGTNVRGTPWNERPDINHRWDIPPVMGVCTVGFRVVQELPLADQHRKAGASGSSGNGR